MIPKYITTGNPVFFRMREDFDEGINDALKRMLKNGVDFGKVTCTLEITLVEEEISGTHGILRMAKTPVFAHKVKTSVSQGMLINGETQMQGIEVRLDQEGNPFCSKYGGQMTLFDNEEDTDDEVE